MWCQSQEVLKKTVEENEEKIQTAIVDKAKVSQNFTNQPVDFQFHRYCTHID